MDSRITTPKHVSLGHDQMRIIGDTEVQPHSKPYTVALFEADTDSQFCGGSILEYVQPIKLSNTEPPVGTVVGSFGWGRTGDDPNSEALMETWIPVVSDDVAAETYPTGDLNMEHLICVDTRKGQSPCDLKGDSGGPLVWETNEEEEQLIGIAAFVYSFGCWEGLPACFTSVPNFLQWINDNKQ